MADVKHEQSMMHGKALSEAVKAEHEDAVPGDDKAHAHSHAAHLGTEGKAHTGAEGDRKQGIEPSALREPPQDPERMGKTQHRQ